jgi:hypothetical protein
VTVGSRRVDPSLPALISTSASQHFSFLFALLADRL